MTTTEIEHADRGAAPGGLGRHINHDPESRRYAHRPSTTATLVSKVWDRNYAVLDQGQTRACTGNAMLGAVYTGHVFSSLTGELKAKYQASEVTARDVIYHLATTLDPFTGTFPPDDTGSDGTSASKAAQQLGLIAGYRHTFSLDDALATVSHDSHVITGVNWYAAFDSPDVNGLVKLPKRLPQPEGGHEFLVYGIDTATERVLARNSWGIGWGGSTDPAANVGSGEFQFSFSDWGRLLGQQGDVTVPVPLTGPAPGPEEPSILTEFKRVYDDVVAWIEAHL